MTSSSDSLSRILTTWGHLPTSNGRVLYQEPTSSELSFSSQTCLHTPRAFCIACFHRQWSLKKNPELKRRMLYKAAYSNPMKRIKPKFDLAPVERLDSLPAEESEVNTPFEMKPRKNVKFWRQGTKSLYEACFPE